MCNKIPFTWYTHSLTPFSYRYSTQQLVDTTFAFGKVLCSMLDSCEIMAVPVLTITTAHFVHTAQHTYIHTCP